MRNWMTKKNVLVGSTLFSILFFVSGFQKEIGICGKVSNSCWDFFDLLWPFFSIFLSLFIVSLFTHHMKEQTFRSWVRFVAWWVPLSMLLIFITPTTTHSWAVGGPTRESITWLMDGLSLAISLILIIKKSVQLRGGK